VIIRVYNLWFIGRRIKGMDAFHLYISCHIRYCQSCTCLLVLLLIKYVAMLERTVNCFAVWGTTVRPPSVKAFGIYSC
jgi:hypothetical protein